MRFDRYLLSLVVMEFRQLSALLAVADHGSFSGAARALYTVQSNVSTHIARLERELGVVLVDRARGRLTEEGTLVAARARRIQQEIDAVQADVASLGQHVSGDVRVGVIGTTARWLVPRMLMALRQLHPGVRAVVVEASTTSLVPQLVSGPLDLAVVNLPLDDPDLTATALFDEDLVLVAPERHPLAARDRIDFAELANHPVLIGPPGTVLRDDLDVAAAKRGFRLQALAEIDGVRLMASLAFGGFGPAVLPATAVPGWLSGPWTRVAVDGLPRRQVGLARRRRGLLSAPGRALAGVLIDVVGEQAAGQPGLRVLTDHAAGAPARGTGDRSGLPAGSPG